MLVAEEVALRKAKKLQIVVSIFIVSTLLFIMLALALTLYEGKARQRDTQQVRLAFCIELEKVRTYVRDAALRAERSLPQINYYKQNPQELEEALDNVSRQRRAFSPPLDCAIFSTQGYTGDTPEDTGQTDDEGGD